jgi:hypothetical protein
MLKKKKNILNYYKILAVFLGFIPLVLGFGGAIGNVLTFPHQVKIVGDIFSMRNVADVPHFLSFFGAPTMTAILMIVDITNEFIVGVIAFIGLYNMILNFRNNGCFMDAIETSILSCILAIIVWGGMFVAVYMIFLVWDTHSQHIANFFIEAHVFFLSAFGAMYALNFIHKSATFKQ